MTEIVISSDKDQHLKITQGYYLGEGRIGIVNRKNDVHINTFIRILIHEEHHRILDEFIGFDACIMLDNVEDTDNLLYDEINLNLEKEARE